MHFTALCQPKEEAQKASTVELLPIGK